MQNSTTNSVSNRVSQLFNLLQNCATMLPVFVRFQQVDKYLTLPVVDVVLNGEILEVKTDDGTTQSINIEALLDIAVFSHASGKPVFITEFPTGGDIAAPERALIEVWDRVNGKQQNKHRLNNPIEECHEFKIDKEIGGVNGRLAA